jgi:predicted transcriptional regulator
MTISRRDKLKIYNDLLTVLNEEAKREKIVLSWIQVKTNLPFDRLKKNIQELIQIGLIEDEVSLKLTAKGKQYIKEYKKVLEFIKRMGIAYE